MYLLAPNVVDAILARRLFSCRSRQLLGWKNRHEPDAGVFR
jgi:hypothetical protein